MHIAQEWTRNSCTSNSQSCSQLIKEGLEKNSFEDIERGLNLACDLFIRYVLEDQYEDMVVLGQDLKSIAYSPHWLQVGEASSNMSLFLGQINALTNLCDHITQHSVPDRLWRAVNHSKYARPILQALFNNGAMLATDLCIHADIPHAAQLSRTIQITVDEGLVRREKFGKNVKYSLTSTGRLMASKHFEPEGIKVIETILPAVINKLAGGRQSLSSIIDDIQVNIPISLLVSITSSILTALQEVGIAEEHEGTWQVSPTISGKSRQLVNTTTYPGLEIVAAIIAKEYEQLQVTGIVNEKHVHKAQNTLDKVEAMAITGKSNQATLKTKIFLERAKCSALEGSWQDTSRLVNEVRKTALTHGISAKLLAREIEEIYPHIEAGCIAPLVARAREYMAKGEYYQARDTMLITYDICRNMQSWTNKPSISIEFLQAALDATTTTCQLQQGFEQKLDEALAHDNTLAHREKLWVSRSKPRVLYRRGIQQFAETATEG